MKVFLTNLLFGLVAGAIVGAAVGWAIVLWQRYRLYCRSVAILEQQVDELERRSKSRHEP